jgi:hypothetical protein
MTFAEDVVRSLRQAGRPLDDDELAARLGVVRQQVNQVCRRLEDQRVLRRGHGQHGKIVNELLGSGGPRLEPRREPQAASRAAAAAQAVTEDEVKQAVKEYLEERGFSVVVAWGRVRGIDLDARCETDRWIVEAKGEAPSGPQQVNYFLGALGELVQRMSDPSARYALALPDHKQYRGLVDRLPLLARERLGLAVFFVRREGAGYVVDVDLRA